MLAEVLFWILQMLGEVVLNVIVELLFDGAGHLARRRWGPFFPPWLALLGYVAAGAACGAFSLWLFPHSFAHGAAPRLLCLIFIPPLMGGVMAFLGRIRTARGREVIRLESCVYGTGLAFAFSAVRFFWAV